MAVMEQASFGKNLLLAMIRNGGMKQFLLVALVPALLYFAAADAAALEEPAAMMPLGDSLGLAKTVLSLHAPPDNEHLWGTISGTVHNHAAGYPVIIQIYDNSGNAVHFAQVGMDESGSFEYVFRVGYVEDGIGTNIFEGDYNVIVSGVVRLDAQSQNVMA